MAKMRLRLALSFFAFLLLFPCIVRAEEAVADIYSDEIVFQKDSEQVVRVYIQHNPGLMGFKLSFHYSRQAVEVASVTRGDVTANGNFMENLGLREGQFDVLWNSTKEIKDEGVLLQLRIRCMTDDPFSIKVTYSQGDTFNERYEDVLFCCSSIGSEAEESIQETAEVSLDHYGILDPDLVTAITETLLDNNVNSLEISDEEKKTEVLQTVNEIARKETGDEPFTDYKAFVSKYRSALKTALELELADIYTDHKTTANNNREEKAPKEILNELKLGEVYRAFLNEEDIQAALQLYETQPASRFPAEVIWISATGITVIGLLILFLVRQKRRRRQ